MALSFGSSHEFWLRIFSIPQTLLMYIKTIFLPYDLHYYRSVDILQPFWIPLVLLMAVIGTVFYMVWKQPKEQRKVSIFGLGWFIITLGPMLNILPLVNEYSLILTSEHFLYLPLVGVIIFVLGNKIFNSSQKDLVFILLSIFLIGITVQQNTYWRSESALFERTVRYEPNFGRGRILLAKAYMNEGRFQESIAENQKALNIMQGYIKKVKNHPVKNLYLGFVKGIYLDMAHCFFKINQPQQAEEVYQKALKVFPRN